MKKFIDAFQLSNLPIGSMQSVTIGDTEVLLANVDGEIYALSNRCGHMSASLADGTLDGTTITCPFHSARFDVTTGKKVRDAIITPPPALEKAPPEMLPYLQKAGRLSAPIKTHNCPKYDVEIDGDTIKICLNQG